MIAIIKTGGKQYKVKVGDKIKVEKLEGNSGDVVKIPSVLFLGDEKELKIGTPTVAKVQIEAKIISTKKGKKVTGIKHKAKKRYKVKFGHRQEMTEIEIIKIA